jgi:hypothetical protein
VPLGLLRVALLIGFAVDLAVALLSIFFQSWLQPLLDFPVKDPALTTIAGGEFFVVALIYVAILRAPRRFAPLLWLVALDQIFAAVLVAIEIGRGHVPGTWKTLGPIPINLALAAVYLLALRGVRRARPESYRHGG